MEQTAGYRPVMYGLMPGDKVEYTRTYKKGKKVKHQVYNCTVVSETKYFITLQVENYKVTVDKMDIGKDVQLLRLGDNEMYNKEPKITAEQLLEECRLHGTGKEAEKVIAEKYGLSVLTVRTYITNKHIKDILKAEQPAPAKVEELKPEEPAPVVEAKEQEPEHKTSEGDWEEFWDEYGYVEQSKESVPVAELRVLTPMHIGMKGEVFSYLLQQGEIVIHNGNSGIGNLSVEKTKKLIQELEAAIEIYNNLFDGGVANETC